MADTGVFSYDHVISAEDIEYIQNLPEVIQAKADIDAKISGSVYFSVQLTQGIKDALQARLGLDLSSVTSVPMRWIKGDTLPHMDTGRSTFENTYLMYLTDSAGELLIDGTMYPITEGSAYVFNEGLSHETSNTGTTPRLLLGPMSEEGFAVGIFIIDQPGGTTLYIRQSGPGYEYSTDQSSWQDFYWPCQLTNTNTSAGNLIIEFTTNITLTHAYEYLVCASDHIQFGSSSLKENGDRPTISIDGITGYGGLIWNGENTVNGYSHIYICNLIVSAINGSTLAEGAGWFGRENFGYNVTENYILNCYSDGPIGGNYCGGILGSGPIQSSEITIINCSSSGEISGQLAGGIVGYLAGGSGGTFTCISCWSTGAISGESAGGITGGSAGFYNPNILISNCYSTGAISGAYAGGICGRYTKGTTVEKSYSTGNMTGIYCGGIISTNAEDTIISNCYTTGTINGLSMSGGILAHDTTNVTVTNCYTTGALSSGAKGYIIGNLTTEPATTYSEAYHGTSGWDTTHANTVLQGVPTSVVGDIWVASITGNPYELRQMGYTPYTTSNILISSDGVASMKRTFTSTISPGSATVSAVITDASGLSYAIIQKSGGSSDSYGTITIGQYNGIIHTSSQTAIGTYTLYIRHPGSYNITTYTLTVQDSQASDCCAIAPFNLKQVDASVLTEYKRGNAMVESYNNRRGPISYSDMLYAKQAFAYKH
jgi:hypothetical protein